MNLVRLSSDFPPLSASGTCLAHVPTFRERGNVTEGALDRFSPCSASRTSELKQPLAAYAEAKQAQNANLGLAEGNIDVNFSALRS
jgi:hypothetical protein